MNTIEQNTEKNLMHEICDKLQRARQELDEFAVQLALGKAEARDKFEEMKKVFIKRLNELNELFIIEGKKDEARKKIDTLEEQLYVGDVNEKTPFDGRIEKILTALEAVRTEIRKKIITAQQQMDFEHDVEMFRLKLEILRLKFGLKKFEVTKDFQVKMEEARKKIMSITSKAKEKMKMGNNKYTGFADEAQLAYKHFRKALKALRP